MNSNWKINRVGLVDFWYYDDEEFVFDDGRMLLRGANGSGKSVTMQSLIPLLLDGNMRPERLDAFGTKARKMENYLLEEDDDREERTGYLYMELKREENEEYASFGIGIRARRNKSLESWYFQITDSRRIGKDILLYKEMDGKITLSKTELKNKLAEGGRVMESQSEYLTAVNKTLFGFENEDEYKELIDILIRLRAPKLSKDLKPTLISEILSGSLQPLSDDDLKPMSDAIEKMDETKLNLENLQDSLASAKQIEKVYKLYNEVVLFNKAGFLLEAEGDYKKLKKEETESQKRLEDVKREIESKDTVLKELESEENRLREEKNSLGSEEIVKLKENEGRLEGKALSLEDTIKDKEKREEDKKERQRSLQKEIREDKDEAESLWEACESILNEMDNELESVPFDDFAFMREELEKNKNEKYSFEPHTKTFEDYASKAKEGKRLLEEEAKQSDKYDRVLKVFDEYKSKQDDLEKTERQCETLLHDEKQRLTEEVYAWEKGNVELHVDTAHLQGIEREIEYYDENKNYYDIKNILKPAYERVYGEIFEKKLRIDNETLALKEEIKGKELELAEWQNKKDPEPLREESVIKNREKLRSEGIEFLNFYKTVDFAANLAEDERNSLEEALLDMGILDAIIVSGKDRDKVLAFDKGLGDRYIFDDVKAVNDNILNKFEIEEEYNNIFSNFKINAALSSISLKKTENSGTWIGENGSYGLGVIEGKTTGEYKASFIGALSRENYRIEKINELENDIRNLQEEIRLKEENLRIIHAREEELNKEWESFPKPDSMNTALGELNKVRERLKGILEDIARLKTELDSEKKALDEIRLAAHEACGKCYVKANLRLFEELNTALEDYRVLLVNLSSSHKGYLAKLDLICSKETNLLEVEEYLDNIRYELSTDRAELKDVRARLDSVREQLKLTDYDKIKDRIDSIEKRLNEIPPVRTEASMTLGRRKQEEADIEKSLEGFKPQLESRLKHRDDMERAFKDELKLGLVEVLELNEEVLKLAERLRLSLREAVGDTKLEDVFGRLQETFHKYRGGLTRYNVNMKYLFTGEAVDYGSVTNVKRLDISAKYKGSQVKFGGLVSALDGEVLELENILKESDREIYEDILIGTVGRKIRAKIRLAEKWVGKIKLLMESMETSSGLTLSLAWKPKKAEKEEELGTKVLVDILMRDEEILRPEDSANLSGHFRSKINEAKKAAEESGGMKSFYAVIRDILDYRKWYEFTLMYQRAGENKKELTDRVFFTFSGGEKAMAMYVPLFSAVVAKYQGAREDAPRLVALDEAFAGVDETNIRDMFRLMSEFEFNFVINSQSLWGDYDTVPALAIYQLVRPENAKYVTVIRYRWNGTRRELVDGVSERG